MLAARREPGPRGIGVFGVSSLVIARFVSALAAVNRRLAGVPAGWPLVGAAAEPAGTGGACVLRLPGDGAGTIGVVVARRSGIRSRGRVALR